MSVQETQGIYETVQLRPATLQGVVRIPASKSAMQRACAAALLRTGETIVCNPGCSHDDRAALRVIQQLGADVQQHNGILHIRSNGVQPIGEQIHCGESGLGVRMFTPIAALSNKHLVIEGEGSLTTRPLSLFDDVLPQLGVEVHSNNGKLPLHIQGSLHPVSLCIDGSLSSQFLTGLLFAYAAANATGVQLSVCGLKSKPYINLTLRVLQHFGWCVEHRNYEEFFFRGYVDPAPNKPLEYTVEGDWSSAAFLLVGGALTGPVRVEGLHSSSVQADKSVLTALQACGADVLIECDAVTVSHAALRAFAFDATDCPDLFPPLVALAAYCSGVSTLRGVHRLAHKESDRATALREEFGKMGVEISIYGDEMHIVGGASVRGARVYSHNDHRIAMACAIASTRAEGSVCIEHAHAVNKSYPEFYTHLQQLGGNVESSVHNCENV